MTPYLLIIFGLILFGTTLWEMRNEETNPLFWTDFSFWTVNKTEDPTLYRVTIVIHIAVAVLMTGIGIVWLLFFR